MEATEPSHAWNWSVAALVQHVETIAAHLEPTDDARILVEAARRLRNLGWASADVLLLIPKLDRLRGFVEGGLTVDVGGKAR
jgi:hypothetical protein